MYQIFFSGNKEGIAMRPRPEGGQGWRKGNQRSKKRISTETIFSFFGRPELIHTLSQDTVFNSPAMKSSHHCQISLKEQLSYRNKN